MDRMRAAGRAVALPLFIVALAAAVLWILTQLAAGNEEREQQATSIAALQSGLDEANARLAEEGEPPVDVPEVEPGADPAVPQIVPGPRGFTGVQGIQGRTGPPGETGPRGRPGRDGMDGRPGADGVDGEPGADGADGKDGANGLPGKDGLDGAPGKDGAPGQAGPRGVGIAKIECHSTGDWIFTMTDGTAQTVTGPCRVEPSPPPTTTKTR